MTVQIKVRYERSAGGSRDTYSTRADTYPLALDLLRALLDSCDASGWRVLRVTLEPVV